MTDKLNEAKTFHICRINRTELRFTLNTQKEDFSCGSTLGKCFHPWGKTNLWCEQTSISDGKNLHRYPTGMTPTFLKHYLHLSQQSPKEEEDEWNPQIKLILKICQTHDTTLNMPQKTRAIIRNDLSIKCAQQHTQRCIHTQTETQNTFASRFVSRFLFNFSLSWRPTPTKRRDQNWEMRIQKQSWTRIVSHATWSLPEANRQHFGASQLIFADFLKMEFIPTQKAQLCSCV